MSIDLMPHPFGGWYFVPLKALGWALVALALRGRAPQSSGKGGGLASIERSGTDSIATTSTWYSVSSSAAFTFAKCRQDSCSLSLDGCTDGLTRARGMDLISKVFGSSAFGSNSLINASISPDRRTIEMRRGCACSCISVLGDFDTLEPLLLTCLEPDWQKLRDDRHICTCVHVDLLGGERPRSSQSER
jgi:hypothetical protein